jgi:exonuclease 3'-5' domain-containing protein 1
MSSYNAKDITTLLSRLSLPKDTEKFHLCDDATSVKEAVDVLSACSSIILDCEALSLGNQGGTLSLISLRSTPISSARTFIIDTIALSKEELQPILDLIQSTEIQKVVFDGRMDFCALYFEYNTRIENVLDLQLADVQSRALRGESTYNQQSRLIGYLLRSEVTGWRRGRYEQVQMLAGIARCLKDHNIRVQDKTVCKC